MLTISIGLLIIFFAGIVQGITSFGFSLLALPLLSFILPVNLIVPLLNIYSFLMNTFLLYKLKDDLATKKIIYLLIFGIIGTPIGTYLLTIVEQKTLKLVAGIIIIILAFSLLTGKKIEFKKEKLSTIPIGLTSGIFNGSLSFSGPPIILFFMNQGTPMNVFRANLTFYFWILNIIVIPSYFFSGLLNKEVASYVVYLLPALIGGVFSGYYLSKFISESLFKKITLWLLTALGLLIILSTI